MTRVAVEVVVSSTRMSTEASPRSANPESSAWIADSKSALIFSARVSVNRVVKEALVTPLSLNTVVTICSGSGVGEGETEMLGVTDGVGDGDTGEGEGDGDTGEGETEGVAEGLGEGARASHSPWNPSPQPQMSTGSGHFKVPEKLPDVKLRVSPADPGPQST